MKKYLLSLFVGLTLLIGFGYCDNAYIFSNVGNDSNYFGPGDCWLKSNQAWPDLGVKAYNLSGDLIRDFSNDDTRTYITMYCMDFSGYLLQSDGTPYTNVNWTRWNVSPLFPSCPTCEEQYTSSDCQLEYGLMPIENCNSEFCELNNLCSSGNLDLSGNWSALYINDIQHLSAPLIDITIPEEFNWSYTGNDELFELSISGYNVDTAYIDGIIRTQNYKPTSEDFTKLISLFVPYSKYLIFLLFIFIIWAWIKKSFKSKKL